MRGHVSIAVFAVATVAFAGAVNAQPCARADFEAVVDQASATLVNVAQKNTPAFQSKLRALKDKRGWTNEQLMQDGAPFVRDDTISAFDEKSEELLIKINSQASASADCKVLADLKGTMAALVETQTSKWAYMFDKIDKELAK
jgi:predicted dithiol-disulfide oxidoreductase (DUF899 family)